MLIYTSNAKEIKNALQYETSPYLTQHETNPVHWFAWGEEAFAKAKREHKPIYLSIGYSTCYWCHVMAEESFTNQKIAELLNKYFISIKIDMEEYPQIDTYYQEIYKKKYKHAAGWPLNVFVNANKEAFFISNYLPPHKEDYSEGLDTLVPQYGTLYKKEYTKILAKIQEIKNAKSVIQVKKKSVNIKSLTKSILQSYNSEYPGFGETKQFPQMDKLQLMFDLALIKNDDKMLQNTYNMLDMMAMRGLYDHIEGGFFRYASDSAWEIAHYEKMLYNQAQILPLYIQAYMKTKKPLYKKIVTESIKMLDDKFAMKNVYYSASDTGEHHKEGEYFIFTQDEVHKALAKNKHKEVLEDALEFVTEGNFHGKVHLNFYTDERPVGYMEFRKELLKVRKTKKYPFIDKKINTAWNSMMIETLYLASHLDIKFKNKADASLKALSEMMFNKGVLHHQALLGRKPIQKGLLEDYSFFIGALIAGYEIDYDENKLKFAEYLLSSAKRKFYKKGVWYLSDDTLNVKATLNDKYYTSPLSKMLQNIIKLASLKSSFKYEKIALNSLKVIDNKLSQLQSFAPAAARAYLMQDLGFITIKSNVQVLKKNSIKLQMIHYPYVLSKSSNHEDFLGCTMRRCFVKDMSLEKVVDAIKLNTKVLY